MAQRQYVINIEWFSEYVYRLLRKITPEQLERFSTKERAKFAELKKLRNFVRMRPLDELLMFALKLDVQWAVIVSPDGKTAEDLINETASEYTDATKRMSIIESFAEKKLCVFTSNDVLIRAELAAQNCRTKVYSLSQYALDLEPKFQALGMGRVRFSKKSQEDSIKDAENALVNFTKLSIAERISESYLNTTLGLTNFQMMILQILFINRQQSTSMRKLAMEADVSADTMANVKKAVKHLLSLKYIITDNKNPDGTIKDSTCLLITGAGVKTVTQWRKHVNNKFMQ